MLRIQNTPSIMLVVHSVSHLHLEFTVSVCVCSCEWLSRRYSEGVEHREWSVHGDTAGPRGCCQMVSENTGTTGLARLNQQGTLYTS